MGRKIKDKVTTTKISKTFKIPIRSNYLLINDEFGRIVFEKLLAKNI